MPVTTSHPPHRIKAARAVGALARMVNHKPATSKINAAGSSHEIWPPNSVLNSRVRPVGPHRDPAWLPPPTLPFSLPVNRPKPL